jgi:hypothetical protein
MDGASFMGLDGEEPVHGIECEDVSAGIGDQFSSSKSYHRKTHFAGSWFGYLDVPAFIDILLCIS